MCMWNSVARVIFQVIAAHQSVTIKWVTHRCFCEHHSSRTGTTLLGKKLNYGIVLRAGAHEESFLGPTANSPHARGLALIYAALWGWQSTLWTSSGCSPDCLDGCWPQDCTLHQKPAELPFCSGFHSLVMFCKCMRCHRKRKWISGYIRFALTGEELA